MPNCFWKASVSTSCMSLPSGPNTDTLPSFLAASTVCCHSEGALTPIEAAAEVEAAGLAGLLADAGDAAGAALAGPAAALLGATPAGLLAGAGAAPPPQAAAATVNSSVHPQNQPLMRTLLTPCSDRLYGQLQIPCPPRRERAGVRAPCVFPLRSNT